MKSLLQAVMLICLATAGCAGSAPGGAAAPVVLSATSPEFSGATATVTTSRAGAGNVTNRSASAAGDRPEAAMMSDSGTTVMGGAGRVIGGPPAPGPGSRDPGSVMTGGHVIGPAPTPSPRGRDAGSVMTGPTHLSPTPTPGPRQR